MQDMVATAKGPASFDGDEVWNPGDDAEELVVAPRVLTNIARIFRAEVPADAAALYAFVDHRERLSQSSGIVRRTGEHVKR